MVISTSFRKRWWEGRCISKTQVLFLELSCSVRFDSKFVCRISNQDPLGHKKLPSPQSDNRYIDPNNANSDLQRYPGYQPEFPPQFFLNIPWSFIPHPRPSEVQLPKSLCILWSMQLCRLNTLSINTQHFIISYDNSGLIGRYQQLEKVVVATLVPQHRVCMILRLGIWGLGRANTSDIIESKTQRQGAGTPSWCGSQSNPSKPTRIQVKSS